MVRGSRRFERVRDSGRARGLEAIAGVVCGGTVGRAWDEKEIAVGENVEYHVSCSVAELDFGSENGIFVGA